MPRNPLVKSGVVDRLSGGGRRGAEVDAGRAASTLEVKFVGSPEWSSWYRIPAHVLIALENAGFTPLEAYTAGAYEPRVRQRRDQFIERAKAWFVDYDAFVLIDAVRDLRRRPDGRFERTSSWKLTARRQAFVGDVRERSGTVAVDVAEIDADLPAAERAAVDVIDVLPAPVRRQVLGVAPEPEIDHDTLTEATSKGRPSEHEAGLVRVTGGRLIAVSATRKIDPKRMSVDDAASLLAVTPWDVMTVTATLDRERVTEIKAAAEREELDSPNREALTAPPSGHDSGE